MRRIGAITYQKCTSVQLQSWVTGNATRTLLWCVWKLLHPQNFAQTPSEAHNRKIMSDDVSTFFWNFYKIYLRPGRWRPEPPVVDGRRNSPGLRRLTVQFRSFELASLSTYMSFHDHLYVHASVLTMPFWEAEVGQFSRYRANVLRA